MNDLIKEVAIRTHAAIRTHVDNFFVSFYLNYFLILSLVQVRGWIRVIVRVGLGLGTCVSCGSVKTCLHGASTNFNISESSVSCSLYSGKCSRRSLFPLLLRCTEAT